MRSFNMILSMACVLALAGCNADKAPTPSDTAAATPAAESAQPEAGTAPTAADANAPATATGIWFEPAQLSACGSGKDVVTVHWDVSASPAVTMVKISPIENGVPAAVFATGAAQGSKQTGPWMKAGGTMAVLDANTDQELARGSVGSIPCDQ